MSPVTKIDLESRIIAAFEGVVLGEGIGLLEADAWDSCVDPEKPKRAREKDERHSWHALTPVDLHRHCWSLPFTDAEGFRFLIPAFMSAELRCELDETSLIHLSHVREDKYDRYFKLNSEQLATIVDFLVLFQDDPDTIFHREAIAQALEIFWKPRLKRQFEAEALQ